MNITTNDDWTWVGGSYEIGFATTDDPRVVAVIQRDDERSADETIDGDVYAPAFWYDRDRGGFTRAGSTFMDAASEEIAERVEQARDRFMYRRLPNTVIARYAWIFHETTFEQVSSTIDRDAQVVIFNTPSWREHVGITADLLDRFKVTSITGPGQGVITETVQAGTELEAQAIHLAQHPLEEGRRVTRVERETALTGEVETWQGYLNGDVFGIGWAVNEGRVLDDGHEIDLEDTNWDIEIQCWGFIGETYAQQSAAAFEHGEPELEELLQFEEPGFVEHTDRMAELDIRDAELADRGW